MILDFPIGFQSIAVCVVHLSFYDVLLTEPPSLSAFFMEVHESFHGSKGSFRESFHGSYFHGSFHVSKFLSRKLSRKLSGKLSGK